jgi:hypothetical protein
MSSHNPHLSPSISKTYPLPCTYPEEAPEQPLSPKPLHIGLGLAPVLVPIRPSISPLGGVRRTQSDTRGPPLGDPSLEYMDPGSDFIRLRSAHKRSASSRCVVTRAKKGGREGRDWRGRGKRLYWDRSENCKELFAYQWCFASYTD